MMMVVMMTSMKTTIITMLSAVVFTFTSKLFTGTLELCCSCDILAGYVWARTKNNDRLCGPIRWVS